MVETAKDPGRLLLLYSKDDCSLCDQAEVLVRAVIENAIESDTESDRESNDRWQLQKVDINTDTALNEKYCWSIPVLARSDNGAELHWPFPASRVRKLLSN